MNRIEGEELFERLLKIVEGESSENVEYYQLLQQLQYYDYCMSPTFKKAFYKEVYRCIDFEIEWQTEE
jgi:hypothetical protein